MEQWKDIPGYEGIYQASTEGQIRSTDGKITSNARYATRIWNQRILKQKYKSRKNSGVKDARVSLWKNGHEKTFLVSRLVAMTWCNGYRDGLTVNHIDGDPMNNRAENLEWISLGDNIRHGFANGLYSNQKTCVLINSSGVKNTFRSQCEASRKIGRNSSYIANCRRNNKPIISANGERYDYYL